MQAKEISDIRVLELIEQWWQAVRAGRNPDYETEHAAPLLEREYPRRVVEAKFEKLYSRGFLEYGGNVMGSWLTPRAEEYLASVRAAREAGESTPAVPATLRPAESPRRRGTRP